jgi:hypothetical protein
MNNLGLALKSVERFKDAEKVYRDALDRDPRYAAAWLNLGELMAGQERYDDAIAAFHKALEAQPSYPAARLNLGATYRKAGRAQDAVATYRALVAENPRYVSAWYNLGIAHEALEAKMRPAPPMAGPWPWIRPTWPRCAASASSRPGSATSPRPAGTCKISSIGCPPIRTRACFSPTSTVKAATSPAAPTTRAWCWSRRRTAPRPHSAAATVQRRPVSVVSPTLTLSHKLTTKDQIRCFPTTPHHS